MTNLLSCFLPCWQHSFSQKIMAYISYTTPNIHSPFPPSCMCFSCSIVLPTWFSGFSGFHFSTLDMAFLSRWFFHKYLQYLVLQSVWSTARTQPFVLVTKNLSDTCWSPLLLVSTLLQNQLDVQELGTPHLSAAYVLVGIGTYPSLENPRVAPPLPMALVLETPQHKRSNKDEKVSDSNKEACMSLLASHGTSWVKDTVTTINSFWQLITSCYASHDLVFESHYRWQMAALPWAGVKSPQITLTRVFWNPKLIRQENSLEQLQLVHVTQL